MSRHEHWVVIQMRGNTPGRVLKVASREQSVRQHAEAFAHELHQGPLLVILTLAGTALVVRTDEVASILVRPVKDKKSSPGES